MLICPKVVLGKRLIVLRTEVSEDKEDLAIVFGGCIEVVHRFDPGHHLRARHVL